jgi:transposase
VAGFIAEVGDISRFSHPRQIQKLAGLNLKENSSGKHKGKTTISKRGRKRLRTILFQGILPLVATNEEFKKLHQYYTTREENPLTQLSTKHREKAAISTMAQKIWSLQSRPDNFVNAL